MTIYWYLVLQVEGNFSDHREGQWDAGEFGCKGAKGLDGEERFKKSWLDVEVWRHWRAQRRQLIPWWAIFCARLGNAWWQPTRLFFQEVSWCSFYFCSGPNQSSDFWEGLLRSLPWALLFQDDRCKVTAPAVWEAQPESCPQQLTETSLGFFEIPS